MKRFKRVADFEDKMDIEEDIYGRDRTPYQKDILHSIYQKLEEARNMATDDLDIEMGKDILTILHKAMHLVEDTITWHKTWSAE